jgi:hypothetical protein
LGGRGEREVVTLEEKINQETPDKIDKKPAKPVRMKPLFTWKTVVILGFGLIAGLVIGLTYWLYSPSISGSGTNAGGDNQTTGLLGMLGMVPDGPYQSIVYIQVVNPGSDYTPLSTLQQRAEYYSAKALSLPFFEYLNVQLNEQIPGFSANVDKLGKMISSSYSARTELPVIRITVTAPTEAEATALAELVPQDFNSYLVSEEKDKTHKDYLATLTAIDTVKTALYQAQQDLTNLKQNDISDTNPDVIVLKAKVDALQASLNTQITAISVQSEGDLQVDYDNTLQQMSDISTKINEAKGQLATMQTANVTVNLNDSSRIMLDSKIRALQTELDRSMASMVAMADASTKEYVDALKWIDSVSANLSSARKEMSLLQSSQNQTMVTPETQIIQIQLDTLNAQQATLTKKLSQLYQQLLTANGTAGQAAAQSQFSQTSLALAQAKKDLDAMETQLGYDRLNSDLNLSVAQNNVNNLNARLQSLTQQLGSLVGGNINSLETDYLVAGNPSAPFPVLPTRAKAKSTLMMGAIAGIVIAWALWNIKWIIKQIKSLAASKPEEPEEK